MSTTIDLGKLRFNWVGTWEAATEYEINDLVKHGGDVFVYIYGVKTIGNLTTNTIYWALVQEGMAWQGEYDATVAYLPHQVVHHANNSYICILEEPVAGATEPPNSTYWQLLVTGFKFEGLYNDSTTYQVDDIVYYGANTFICIQNTTGTNDPEDTAYWAIFSHGMRWVGVYDAAVTYRKDDILTYGINAYVAKHDVTGTLPTDASHFDRLTEGLDWKNVFDITTPYQKNDIVRYGTNVYIAKLDTVGNLPTDAANWDPMSEGLSWENVFDITTLYYKHDVVKYGANVYIAKQDTVGNLPTDTSNFDSLTDGIRYTSNWDSTKVDYRINDVVIYGGNSYIATADTPTINSSPSINTSQWDRLSSGVQWEGVYNVTKQYQKDDIVSYGGNTFIAKQDTIGNIPTDTVNWDELNNGISSRGDWVTAIPYYLDDIVSYGGQTYICLQSHISGDAGNDLAAGKWQLFSAGLEWKGTWVTSTLYYVNNIVNSGGSTYICSVEHTSTDFVADSVNWESFANAGTDVALTISSHGDLLYRDATGPASLSAGNGGQVLTSKGPNADPEWGDLIEILQAYTSVDTSELIISVASSMNSSLVLQNVISVTSGNLEVQGNINGNETYSIDRDTGQLSVSV